MSEKSREELMVILERDADGNPTVWCDPEIADLVSALNKAGIRTVASCSGHGRRPGNIMLEDGRELVIARDFDEARKIDAMFPGINGEPPAVQGEVGEGVPDYINDAIDNLAHANYELSYSGYQERTRDVELIRAYVARARQPTPQPAEQQQPSLQSPPDDPLGGLEHRADGESNFYTLSRPTGNWVARIQFNGELHTHEQERILNAMLSDRNVRYGDGYHQGYWDARQKSPDVAGLVEALEFIAKSVHPQGNGPGVVIRDVDGRDWRNWLETAEQLLAAHRKQGGEV